MVFNTQAWVLKPVAMGIFSVATGFNTPGFATLKNTRVLIPAFFYNAK